LKKAFDILERAKKTYDDYWEVYSMLAVIYTTKEKNEEKAIEEGAKAIERNPYDADAYNNLAWIYATSKDGGIRNLANAKDYAQKAVDFTRRGEPSYLDTLAEVYSRMGKPDLASETVKEEIKAIQKKSRNLLEPERRLKEFQEAQKRRAEVAP